MNQGTEHPCLVCGYPVRLGMVCSECGAEYTPASVQHQRGMLRLWAHSGVLGTAGTLVPLMYAASVSKYPPMFAHLFLAFAIALAFVLSAIGLRFRYYSARKRVGRMAIPELGTYIAWVGALLVLGFSLNARHPVANTPGALDGLIVIVIYGIGLMLVWILLLACCFSTIANLGHPRNARDYACVIGVSALGILSAAPMLFSGERSRLDLEPRDRATAIIVCVTALACQASLGWYVLRRFRLRHASRAVPSSAE